MFQTAVITDEVSQDFQVAVDFALRHKLDAVEIRSVDEKNPFEMNQVDIDKMKAILKGTGLKVCCISAPFFKCDIDNKQEIEEHIEGLKRCIHIAKELGCSLIRGFTFWNKGDFEQSISDIVKKFQEPIVLLKQANMLLALEFDPTVYTTNAKRAVMVLKELNSPYVKALWDPGNDIYDEEEECPYPDGYEMIKPYLVHMHLKDAKRVNGKPEAMIIGKGDFDFVGQFKALLNDGYQGYVSLETHYRPAHELSEEILKQPKGSTFSYLGLEASEECMKNWKDIMKKCNV
ncbi:sugar phosphate isomerase/epimerase family protein [Paludicola sp. MB14-C6]|uniref:sugar phosphate isomerase/epimerase family protein n=1 Tax=Paludihabitans sp. MB14-C6 TaxID=3070656 RepID=UPI0027DC29EB|nr:sugar phosphate isomerase/epimerase family protein [Paludicola sp. MB14-C6]WMJ23265.1 sugar phosphate isomerase/epimerase family protein [Paludicola sp. MB14-C6]